MKNWKKIIGGCLAAGMFVLLGCGGGGGGNTTAVTGPMLTIIPSGDSSYVVQGTGMDGVAGIELTISYDAVLHQGTPTVKQESLVSGALPAVNTSLPGSIKIAIISTSAFSGSGPIATITFASKSVTAPIPSLTYSMIDSKGSPFASSTSNSAAATDASGTSTPGVPFSQTATPETISTRIPFSQTATTTN